MTMRHEKYHINVLSISNLDLSRKQEMKYCRLRELVLNIYAYLQISALFKGAVRTLTAHCTGKYTQNTSKVITKNCNARNY